MFVQVKAHGTLIGLASRIAVHPQLHRGMILPHISMILPRIDRDRKVYVLKTGQGESRIIAYA
jgi:translation elongation factor EF-Tu-like GTPase